jgi:uncharacterized protein YcnI
MTKNLLRTLSVFCLIGSTSAMAHITAHPDTGVADSFFETKFLVPHGCEGSSTIAVRIKIPEEITIVKPQMKPGWTISIKTRKLAMPIKGEGGQLLTETVDEVDWQGEKLPDSFYDEFGMVMKLPARTGSKLYFPVVQECETGVNRWINIPAPDQTWNSVRQPAPFVILTAPK